MVFTSTFNWPTTWTSDLSINAQKCSFTQASCVPLTLCHSEPSCAGDLEQLLRMLAGAKQSPWSLAPGSGCGVPTAGCNQVLFPLWGWDGTSGSQGLAWSRHRPWGLTFDLDFISTLRHVGSNSLICSLVFNSSVLPLKCGFQDGRFLFYKSLEISSYACTAVSYYQIEKKSLTL